MQRQPSIGYRRKHVGSGVTREIERVLEQTARAFNVSRSFVIAVALAEAFNIPLPSEQNYKQGPRWKNRKNRRR